jgi:hypothetical protein
LTKPAPAVGIDGCIQSVKGAERVKWPLEKLHLKRAFIFERERQRMGALKELAESRSSYDGVRYKPRQMVRMGLWADVNKVQ